MKPKRGSVTELAPHVLRNGVFVPPHLANDAGLGCDRCDDHEIIPLSLGADAMAKLTTAFLARHAGHGVIHTLERHEGRLFITGTLSPR